MRAIGALLVLVFVSIGCDRASDAGDAAAQRIAEHKERDEGVPCPAHAAGSEVAFGQFAFRFEHPIVVAPETRLPWIANVDERTALSAPHVRALVVPFAFKNTAPAVKSAPQGIVLVTRDGTSHHGWPYNEKLWNQHHGRSVYWELGQVRPDVWIQTALVFDVDPDEVEGAVLYLARIGYVRDLRGSSHRVVYEHAVAELAAPTSGPPIRGLPRR